MPDLVEAPPQTARHEFAYPLATVNGSRLCPSQHASDTTVFVDAGDMLADGRIAATATARFTLRPGTMALWRAVLRTSDGSPVQSLDWLADDRWHEPLLRLDWTIDPVIELRYIADSRSSRRPLNRSRGQTLTFNRDTGKNAASRLTQLASRIPGALRTGPRDAPSHAHAQHVATVSLGSLLKGRGQRDAYLEQLTDAIGTGPPPMLYARFDTFECRIALAQATTVCGESVLDGDHARTKLLTPAVMACLLWEISQTDRTAVLALDRQQLPVAEELITRGRRTLAVAPVAGLPGRGTLLVGQPTGAPISAEEVPVAVALDAIEHHQRSGRAASIDGEVADVVRMMHAPVRGTGRLPNGEQLYGFQERLVAQMEATDRGILLASGTGSGKSAMIVETLNRWAGTTPATRDLILVEDELVAQWRDDVLVGTAEEAGFLTKDAIVRILTPSCNVTKAMRELDAAAGVGPVVFLCGQTVARTAVAALSQTVRRDPGGAEGDVVCFWDVMVIDDADFLIGESAIERAARRIRQNADRCIVANATPYHVSHTDVFKQIGVGRGYSEETMRRGRQRLNKLRVTDTATLTRLHESFSPVIARPTPEEVEHVMPRLAPPLVHEVPPTELEQRAMESIENRLIAALQTLVDAAESAGALDPTSERGRQNQLALDSALRSLRYLGPLASRLACDWEAALASTSNAAQLLALDEDIKRLKESGQTPTMRRLHAELIARSVEGGHPILGFCEHIPPLTLLDQELQSRFGIKAGLLTGSTPAEERHRLCRAFRTGEANVDALLIGPKSIRGKNLQRAQRVLHIDLPPTPPRFAQRNGRAARIGSCWPEIEVIIGLLAGSYMRFHQEQLMVRAAPAVAMLDGANARSHLAGQFAALAADHQLGEHATAAGYIAARLIEQRA
ncbi:DEAD/DEAH box helicase [Conexibacter sp. JD483]|uniref:helicase-related protein n=1 Tax=unclassified Conexibacter TaxID=2627773 RepID=UPI002719A6BB|nr:MULTISPECIES: DEAD/DEAH box helicase [unclassified Conexibacter]MDO8185820.1 DEAD/DEAH box helicase [Conexibacter sp. CPCC 205706]MDO8198564.1 DEAD/DEAH box helicase [Conexibacter sp. CPCC 205762]MDR9367650.1 DEAD/DEAH box helicase [Conexibacter sp. JD483]